MTTCAYAEMASAKVYSVVGSSGAYFFLSVVASICISLVFHVNYDSIKETQAYLHLPMNSLIYVVAFETQ